VSKAFLLLTVKAAAVSIVAMNGGDNPVRVKQQNNEMLSDKIFTCARDSYENRYPGESDNTGAYFHIKGTDKESSGPATLIVQFDPESREVRLKNPAYEKFGEKVLGCARKNWVFTARLVR
jgi:hypothetical protein